MAYVSEEAGINDQKVQMGNLHKNRINELLSIRSLRDLDPSVSVKWRDDVDREKLIPIIANHPKIYWDWCVAELSNLPFEWEVQANLSVERQGEEAEEDRRKAEVDEKRKAELLEYLCYGFDAQMNLVRVMQGMADTWSKALAEQIVSGSYAWATDLFRENGKLYACSLFYDPASVMWLPGRIGMKQVAVVKTDSYHNAQQQLYDYDGGELQVKVKALKAGGSPVRDTPVEVVIFYDMEKGKVYRTMLVDDQVVVPRRAQEGWDEIPLMCGTVNNRGPESKWADARGKSGVVQDEFLGRSVLDTNRSQYPQDNMMDTYASERAYQILHSTMVTKTRGAIPVATKEELETGDVRVVELDSSDPNTSVTYLAAPSAPFDIQREQERGRQNQELGSVPASVISGANAPQFSAAMLQSQLRKDSTERLDQYVIAHNAQAKQGMEQILRKFVRIKGEVDELEGEHLRKTGGVFKATFSYKEMPKLWRVTPKHDRIRPIDKIAIGQAAEAKLKVGAISMAEYMEEVGVKDPAASKARRMREELENHPLAKEKRLREVAYEDMLSARKRMEETNVDTKATEEEKAAAEINAGVAFEIFKQIDASLTKQLGGIVKPPLQGQPGKEAPQPNEPLGMATPSPAVQPSDLRGEGRVQQAMRGQNGKEGM